MKMSKRDRRIWRVVLWLSLGSALISAIYGYQATDMPLHGIATGIASSLCIATPIILFEVWGQKLAIIRRLKRLPLIVYFALRVAFYVLVIIVGLLVARSLFAGPFEFEDIFHGSFSFAIAMSVLTNLAIEIGYLLGFRTLRDLFTGRYVRPRRESRAFLLIDMKNSTGIAERLGPILFHELLNDFFRDVADAALETGAEIHKYVGDEAILTWPLERAMEDGACVACPFMARAMIRRNSQAYRARFGVVPTFRAALHCGEIVAGQIGDVRREIAYVGDTLNTTARLLDAAKTTGHDVLVSTDLLRQVTLPVDLRAEPLPTLEVRGRSAPLAIAALREISALDGEAIEQAAQDALG
ncbi:MAG: adenylate/guanylate cyclase domain-containing protein [Reyranellaceae bacterium]